jgi:putative flippase GtrA
MPYCYESKIPGELMTKNGEVAIEAEPKGPVRAADEVRFAGSRGAAPECARPVPSPLSSALARLFLRRSDGTDSYLGSLASSRLMKFLAVGGIGVVVNLLAMALIFHVTGYRDWRASAIASTIAALHNYFLNNYWTFADRRRSGSALLSGALLYLPMSAAGVAITTVTYSILTHARFRAYFGTSSLYLYAAQLVAISFGTYLNYSLNKFFTWRSDDRVELVAEAESGQEDGPVTFNDSLRD